MINSWLLSEAPNVDLVDALNMTDLNRAKLIILLIQFMARLDVSAYGMWGGRFERTFET